MAESAAVRAKAFLDALPATRRPDAGALPELERSLAELVDAARRSWPGVPLADDDFLRHLAHRLPAEGPVAAALAALRTSDLFLACACGQGVPSAFAAFDQACVVFLGPALASLATAGAGPDDVLQLVREKLLAPDTSGARRIDGYAGTGSLRRWVRAAAVRTALDLARGARESPTDDERLVEELPAAGDDPELGFLKSHYRVAFADAFRAALGALPARQQNLLRQHFVDGLGIDALGRLYTVNRVTAFRWLGAARRALLIDIRGRLGAALGVGSGELDSIVRLVRSRLDVSLRTLG